MKKEKYQSIGWVIEKFKIFQGRVNLEPDDQGEQQIKEWAITINDAFIYLFTNIFCLWLIIDMHEIEIALNIDLRKTYAPK